MTNTLQTQCCIVGGGPAGMMLGLLLSRAGIDVVVLEKHADFLRDFRGDTIHPSTLEVMHELGLLAELLERPHQEVRELGAKIAGACVTIADFSHLPTHARFIALMPQWDFLDFLADHARRNPCFHLLMESEVVDLIEDGDRVSGVKVKTRDGFLDVRCDLTIGADGRASIVRERAGLKVLDIGAPIDALWMRISRLPNDPHQMLAHFVAGHILVMLERGDYWQCAFVIPKGTFDQRRSESIVSLREQIGGIVPFLKDRVDELRSWDDVSLLTVRIDRLQKWSRPGLLCIGDAAHAMSPVGGVGINLAIQDAVATANLLASALRRGTPSPADLRRVQRRRELPTRITQRLQVLVQDRVIRRALDGVAPKVPRTVRLLQRWRFLRRLPARLVGLGFRPEHLA